jgi:undecaprenyl-diphosphatase
MIDSHFFNLIYSVKFLDTKVFSWVNGLAYKWYWLDFIGFLFAKYFEYVLLLVLLLFLVINFKKYWKMVLESLMAVVLARYVIAEIIRWLWFRPRPFVNNYVNLLMDYNPAESSFPSGHAVFYFALSTIVYYHNKKAGILFYLASFLIVLARVFVGIHWPSDILAGALIGIFIAWLINKIFLKVFNRQFSHI